MSAAKTGTPAALSCSASSWRVLVLPVPVAPATSPCRLSMPSGIRMWTSVSVVSSSISPPSSSAGPSNGVARRHRLHDRAVGVRLGRAPAVTVMRHSSGSAGSARESAALALVIVARVIFKRVGDGRPYPDHGLTSEAWAALPPRQVRLDELVTTKDTLAARRAARRGLHLLRRPVRPRRPVAGRALPRGRPAPRPARGPAAAPRPARACAHDGGLNVRVAADRAGSDAADPGGPGRAAGPASPGAGPR